MEKYQELYEYARDLHFRQIERANRLDQKAAMFLSAITVLLGLYSFFMKVTFDYAIPPDTRPEWCLFISVTLSGLTVLISWLAFLSVLRTKRFENLRLDKQTLEFFLDNRRIDILYAISRRAAEAFNTNDTQIATKSRRLTVGYLSALLGVSFLTLSLTIFGYIKWTAP